jgi:hypothetical protein
METLIGLLALVITMIRVGKYWRYVWRVAVVPAALFAIFVGLIVHANVQNYDAKQIAMQHQETVVAKYCPPVDGLETLPLLCK